jgi:Mce-associated membrane protein
MAIHAHPAELVSDGAPTESLPDTTQLSPSSEDDVHTPDAVGQDASAPRHRRRHRWHQSPVRLALSAGLIIVAALGGLVGWLGVQARDALAAQQQSEQFVQAGRQAALNLTTIDWHHIDSDVARILGSATGTFFDDFSKRSQPFIDAVKQSQSVSVGTVTAAGLESATADAAKVLVAVSVKTSNAGAAEQQPRSWRMQMSVQQVDGQPKITDVEFVP